MSEMISLVFEDCVKSGDQVYFFAHQFNSLWKANIKTGIVEYLSSIPGEDLWGERLIGKIFKYGNQLVLTPMRTKKNEVFLFDLITREWRSIFLGEVSVQLPFEKTGSACLYKSKLVIAGNYEPFIWVVDLDTQKVSKYKLGEFDDRKYEAYFFLDGIEIDGFFYLPSARYGTVYKFNIAKEQYDIYKIGAANQSLSGITCDGRDIWIITRKYESLFRWDGRDTVEEIDLPKENCEMNDALFSYAESFEKKIVLIGNKGTVELTNDNKIEVKDNRYTRFKKIDDNTFYIKPESENVCFIENDITYKLEMSVSYDQICGLLGSISNKNILSGKMREENRTVSLRLLLKTLLA